jgi:hypothetical protein
MGSRRCRGAGSCHELSERKMNADEWLSDEVGLLLPPKLVRICGSRSSSSRSGFLDRGGDRIGRMNRMHPNRQGREPVRKTVPFGLSRRRRGSA